MPSSQSSSSSSRYIELAEVVEQLCNAYDALGFLRSQETLKKKELWNVDPTASIQARDRNASYGAAEITAEIHTAEARVHVLNIKRSHIERLIDAQQ